MSSVEEHLVDNVFVSDMLTIKSSRTLQICEANMARNKSNPNLLPIHAATWPCACARDLQLYIYPSTTFQYWFLLNIQQDMPAMVLVGQCGNSYDKVKFALAFRLFVEKSKIFQDTTEIEFRAEAHFMDEIATYAKELKNYQVADAEEYYMFYMTSEQMSNALKDADYIIPDEQKSTALSEAFKKRIQHLPSSCVRETSTGKVVSYELRSFVGTMADQYTVPEYRRKGLGLAVEMTLAQKIISLHEIPFKLVPSYMTSILFSTQESPFWTMWSRNTLPVRYIIQTIKKIV
ncbi:unnamed protein product [Angiostrongylus costaricensis]|uniref:Glycine N-acyltransferase-like protein n=1 Tax=Angiostrongylus costaricensis TaxID=334426 RepID=A0A0R3PPE6_ANGCS|nr:unnamed protein product [Angiostrongylus costaricensis]